MNCSMGHIVCDPFQHMSDHLGLFHQVSDDKNPDIKQTRLSQICFSQLWNFPMIVNMIMYTLEYKSSFHISLSLKPTKSSAFFATTWTCYFPELLEAPKDQGLVTPAAGTSITSQISSPSLHAGPLTIRRKTSRGSSVGQRCRCNMRKFGLRRPYPLGSNLVSKKENYDHSF